ncbi:hypothetical protein AAFF_G00291160 [Aldrovandia affinis]|uniref:Erythropoietin n=1 Tax=Aldrovandia affinis TaxID=143900 RepID=A0AAD7R981_9TELE|nr:hypothetical protein AAFF_G00291160 [Aldrovandia affinis]
MRTPADPLGAMRVPVSGLVAVVLMVLQWLGPSRTSPLRQICDLRVLDHFIKEARDTESTVRSCKVGCDMEESLSVPLTGVNYTIWEKKEVQQQVEEVRAGLWLLGGALGKVRASVSNAALCDLINSSICPQTSSTAASATSTATP